ncbi:MAG: hypothetical protein HN353_05700 [Bdellovibrionales bacterium]|jgi:hypothetical protein|nr:hypothetical protein [Bdellovibrionales bacterium]MBT3525064.1 hypothetical protein [Bdellovibrionales bacterium]MBT7767415.1 hypothetical protein [Bdellovibrionales bacterium]
MMNLIPRFCQSKSGQSDGKVAIHTVLLLLLSVAYSACSDIPFVGPDSAQVQWLDVNPRFSFGDEVGRPIPHLFFDLAPFIDSRKQTISAVILNYQESPYHYGFDTLSGQIFRQHRYCQQSDIYGRFKGEIFRPPFTWGFVPRLLDPQGAPQKIVIFGGAKRFKQEHLGPANSHRFRVVGGLVDRYCPTRTCPKQESWESSIILVGIDPNDPSFRHVHDLDDLKTKVDWKLVRSFLENGRGVKLVRSFVPEEEGSNNYLSKSLAVPAYKIKGESSAKSALHAVLNQGHLFKRQEMMLLRNSCHKLYDLLWFRLEKFKKSTKGSAGKFLRHFYQNYRDRFYTCSKFVRPANINLDTRRHWFFAHMILFFKLNRMEYNFICRNNSWALNHQKEDGKMLIDLSREIKHCNTKNLDIGIRQAVTFIHGLYKNDMDYLRYIEYDQRQGGSHRKIYSWVKERAASPNCQDPKETSSKMGMGFIFPSDVAWESLASKEQQEESLVIRTNRRSKKEE